MSKEYTIGPTEKMSNSALSLVVSRPDQEPITILFAYDDYDGSYRTVAKLSNNQKHLIHKVDSDHYERNGSIGDYADGSMSLVRKFLETADCQ